MKRILFFSIIIIAGMKTQAMDMAVRPSAALTEPTKDQILDYQIGANVGAS